MIQINNTDRSFHQGETNCKFELYQERRWPTRKKQIAINKLLFTHGLSYRRSVEKINGLCICVGKLLICFDLEISWFWVFTSPLILVIPFITFSKYDDWLDASDEN